MGKKDIMISQQAKSIAASAVLGNSKSKSGKVNKPSGITQLREIYHTEGSARQYSFAFFIGALISLIAAFSFGFILGVIGVF
ncbi:MAG: hypothetical protein K8S87_03345 [Planctomycetes bacterium]|nr:hypothetical protein [Planctomycetota bacterium]